MKQHTFLINALLTTMFLGSACTTLSARKTESHPNNYIIPCAIGAVVAGVAGYFLHDYYTQDEKALTRASRLCNTPLDTTLAPESMEIVSHQSSINLFINVPATGDCLRTTVRKAIRELRQLEEQADQYYGELKKRKQSYHRKDRYYQTARETQDSLKEFGAQCNQIRSLLYLGETLATSNDHIDGVIAFTKQIIITHQQMISALETPLTLDQRLAGTDNLKEYWLLINDTITRLTGYHQQLSTELNKIHTIARALPTGTMPQPLYRAYEKQSAYLESTLHSIYDLITLLQKLQAFVGGHPRYGYDNQLYLADTSRRLMQENNRLAEKIGDLQSIVRRLEREKESLHDQISCLQSTIRSLRNSVQSLEWQLHNTPPTQQTIVITQR